MALRSYKCTITVDALKTSVFKARFTALTPQYLQFTNSQEILHNSPVLKCDIITLQMFLFEP